MQEPNHNVSKPAAISFSGLLFVFFQGLLDAGSVFFKFLIRYKWILMLFLLAGCLLGFIRYKTAEPVYKISMIVKSTELTGTTIGQMIDNLDRLTTTKSHVNLSKELGLREEYASRILRIDGRNIMGEDLLKDTTQALNRNYLLDILVNNNSNSDQIQEAILGYFNNNQYLQKRKANRIKISEDKLVFIRQELQKLDSLKTEYNKFLNSGKASGMFYNNAFNPVDLYRQSSDLYEEVTRLEEWLNQSRQSILIIDGVKPSVVPQSMNVVQLIMIFGTVFFLLGCVIMGIRTTYK